MKIGKLLRTISHLRLTQVTHQVAMRLHRPTYQDVHCPETLEGKRGTNLPATFIAKPRAVSGDAFTFLNLTKRFTDWNDKELGMLWAYNLNYMDFLLQEGMDAFDGKMWIDRFLRDLPARTIGLDPYPTALRLINWAKFFSTHYQQKDIPENWRTAYYSQLIHLEHRLEYHLLGNHLLEDAFALYVGWIHMGEKGSHLAQARRLLLGQLREQTLSDGAHYEQSPMYHCILLDRLLDTINFAQAADDEALPSLKETAQQWLGWLDAIVWNDNTIPLFGDSAIGIAPTPAQIQDYARRLGLSWTRGTMRKSGYRKLQNTILETIIDVGHITATYQPGHTHSDPFSFELRTNGRPFVVDTGISTYEKNARRQYERSYEAHNVAQIGKEEPFEVWGGFRVGRTSTVVVISDDHNHIVAQRKGQYKAERQFTLTEEQLTITDNVFGHKAIARFHLAPQCSATIEADGSVKSPLGTFRFEGKDIKVELKPCQVSIAYNQLVSSTCIEAHFKDTLTTSIIPTTQV